jgi:hypothetical protein
LAIILRKGRGFAAAAASAGSRFEKSAAGRRAPAGAGPPPPGFFFLAGTAEKAEKQLVFNRKGQLPSRQTVGGLDKSSPYKGRLFKIGPFRLDTS